MPPAKERVVGLLSVDRSRAVPSADRPVTLAVTAKAQRPVSALDSRAQCELELAQAGLTQPRYSGGPQPAEPARMAKRLVVERSLALAPSFHHLARRTARFVAQPLRDVERACCGRTVRRCRRSVISLAGIRGCL
jgi:hypothetical protein